MYQFKNELIVYDLNNDKGHKLNFDDSIDIYDGEMFILDTRELGFEIACDLQSQSESYDWDEIEKDDVEREIENYLLDITDKLRERILEVCEENEWPIEKY